MRKSAVVLLQAIMLSFCVSWATSANFFFIGRECLKGRESRKILIFCYLFHHKISLNRGEKIYISFYPKLFFSCILHSSLIGEVFDGGKFNE